MGQGNQSSQWFRQHIDTLTNQLKDSWTTLGKCLAGTLRMRNIAIQTGDLLLIEAEPVDAPTVSKAARNLSEVLKAAGTPCTVLVTVPGIKFEAIDPALLEEHGWQRKPNNDQSQPQDLTTTPP